MMRQAVPISSLHRSIGRLFPRLPLSMISLRASVPPGTGFAKLATMAAKRRPLFRARHPVRFALAALEGRRLPEAQARECALSNKLRALKARKLFSVRFEGKDFNPR